MSTSGLHPPDLQDWLRLALTPGVGNATARRLLSAFGLPSHIFAQSRAALQQQGIRQYVVSNGSGIAQHAKLDGSGLVYYMQDCFISEEMGSEKPNPRFFELCAARIPDYDPAHTMIVGDSLTSDMQGGNNAGHTVVAAAVGRVVATGEPLAVEAE